LLKPRKTNFGKKWMNENKHPYSLGHRRMKGDHKDEKRLSCHPIFYGREEFGEGGPWRDEEWRMWKL
jgi:hypothetical protein